MKTFYTASAVSTGDGRDGHVRSSDGALDVDLARPKEMGGPGGGTNPEELFAAGYAACFHSAINEVARRRKITTITDSTVAAEVGIGPRDEESFGLTVALHVELGGLDQAAAEDVVAAAHRMCPYSNATRGNIDVQLTTSVV
jgi:lipoyl-dependent peroxiredoxin